MSKLSISQSLIKDFRDYEKKQFCGLLFDALWISRTHRKDPTDAMMLGRWFEYLALGPWEPGTGTYFQEGMKAAGKKNFELWDELLEAPWAMNSHNPDIYNISDPDVEAHWTAKYYNLWLQARNLRATFEAYGVEILEIQKKHTWDLGGWQRTMVWDVYAKVHKMPDPSDPSKLLDPHYAIIDTKATGLINDKWQDYGWEYGSLLFKDKILIQPIDYLDQSREVTVPHLVDAFYFFVHANTNSIERKIIQVNVPEYVLDNHRKDVEMIAGLLDFDRVKGFKPYPDLKQCEECPLREECEHRAVHPRPQSITII